MCFSFDDPIGKKAMLFTSHPAGTQLGVARCQEPGNSNDSNQTKKDEEPSAWCWGDFVEINLSFLGNQAHGLGFQVSLDPFLGTFFSFQFLPNRFHGRRTPLGEGASHGPQGGPQVGSIRKELLSMAEFCQ
jgi:hypothetical protein